MFQIVEHRQRLGVPRRPEWRQNSSQQSSRNKKVKNIRKGKKGQRNQLLETLEALPKSKLTRAQRQQIQKQKNRIAAQISRDRQKKYVQELETKIQELQTLLQNQQCTSCGSSLLSGGEKPNLFFHESSKDQLLPPIPYDPEFLEEPESFFRSDSSVSIKSIGKFLFIFMIIISLTAFGASVESETSTTKIQGRLMQAIVPYEESHSLALNDQYQGHIVEENIFNGGQCEIVKYDRKAQMTREQIFLEEITQNAEIFEDGQWDYHSEIIICTKPRILSDNKATNENSYPLSQYFSPMLGVVDLIDNIPSASYALNFNLRDSLQFWTLFEEIDSFIFNFFIVQCSHLLI